MLTRVTSSISPGRRNIRIGVANHPDKIELEPISPEGVFRVLTIHTEKQCARSAELQLPDGKVIPLEMLSKGPNVIDMTPIQSIPNISMMRLTLGELGNGSLEIYYYPVHEGNP